MTTVHLSDDTIRKLRDTLSGLGLATEDTRDLLLAHIDKGYAASLRKYDRALDQIYSDLVEMNTVACLENSQVPMEQWLVNAVGMLRARSFPEHQLFQQALDQVRAGGKAAIEEREVHLSESVKKLLEWAFRVPEAKQASARAKRSLEYICQQIKSISEHKDTHELLQQVEDSYRPLYHRLYDKRGELRALEEQDWSETAMTRSILMTDITKLIRKVERMSFRTIAEDGLESLRHASDDLQAADDGKEKPLLDLALDAVQRVIGNQTSRTNTLLVGAIDGLDLSGLVDDLESLCKMVRTHSDAHAAPELQVCDKAIAKLGEMAHELATRRQEHDDWQKLDDNLRRLQKWVLRDVDTFKQEWERNLREEMLALCTPTETDWSRRLGSAMNSLDERLATTPMKQNDVVEAFVKCRSAATTRFAQVDVDLKMLCDDLTETGHDLEVALGGLP